MNPFPLIGCALFGAGVVFLLVPVLLRLAARLRISRTCDFHHTSQTPVPRLGGLALAAALIALELLIGLFLPHLRANVPGRGTVILSSLAMFAIGFWDDLRPLGAKKKLAAQILVASCVYYSGIGIESVKLPFTNQIIELHAWGILLTVFWLVAITNLINLIDGVDGLAGGIALMLMALLVYVGHQNGTFVLLTAGMTGALLAFLWFNFPPARIYLGDGGAYLLGFQIAVFSLVSSHKGTVVAALIAPLFVLALPIVDTSLAILRRGLSGLPLFRPDRRHIHHRLLAAGMSRRKVVITLYSLTLLFLLMGFAVFCSRGLLAPVFLGAAVLLLLLCAGKLSFTREWFAVGRTLGNSLALRHEIQYALTLTNWLKLEGNRCGSLEALYADLVFAGRRLGFTSIHVALPDGDRNWSTDFHCGRTKVFRHNLQLDGGVLDLRAPACMRAHCCPALAKHGNHPPACSVDYDPRLFEILADLLAESWTKAAARCVRGAGPLRFDASVAPVNGLARGDAVARTGRSLASAPAAKTLPLSDDSAAA